MSEFQALKLEIVGLLGLSKDALHIYLGLLVFIVAALTLRVRGSVWWALLAVAIVTIALEALDLRDDTRTLGVLRWSASWHDVANTLFWPAVLTILGHFGAVRFRRPPRSPDGT